MKASRGRRWRKERVGSMEVGERGGRKSSLEADGGERRGGSVEI